MTHEELQSLLGAYALDALDPEEVGPVEDHLAECPRCRAEVASHLNMASYLAASGGEAPPGVWDRIAAELTPPAGAAPNVSLLERPKADPERVTTEPERSKIVPFRRRVGLPIVGALASAAAAAAVVLGVSNADLSHRVNTLSSAVSAGGLEQAAASAVLNPSHEDVQLTSANHRQTLRVVLLPNGTAYLVGSDLPVLSSARTYQLWGLANGKVVSLGLLGSNPQLAAFRVEHGVSRLMVTAEPSGGSPEPTLPVLVQGNLPVSA